MRRTLPKVSNEYVVGLTDGEGCFHVNIWTSRAYRAGSGLQLQFLIKMQERDRELLEKVKNTIGCGAVYFQKEQRANHCQCYRYTVNSHRDALNTIIPFFKKHPLQSVSKRASFEIFCQVATLIEKGAHRTPKGLEHIRALKIHMNQKTIGLA